MLTGRLVRFWGEVYQHYKPKDNGYYVLPYLVHQPHLPSLIEWESEPPPSGGLTAVIRQRLTIILAYRWTYVKRNPGLTI